MGKVSFEPFGLKKLVIEFYINYSKNLEHILTMPTHFVALLSAIQPVSNNESRHKEKQSKELTLGIAIKAAKRAFCPKTSMNKPLPWD